MSNVAVNNDDKRHNGKEDIAYLAVDLRTKSTTGWETSLGCIHNHAKLWEDDEVDENDVKGVQEEGRQVETGKRLDPVVRLMGQVGKDPVADMYQRQREE
jgi:hypothetical protein